MKTLIQGGWVVGFDGREHEVIKDGVVVYDGNRVEFVGKEYTQPVDKKIDAKGCLVSPGFIDTHFHSGINASDYILNDSTKTDFFASNYLAHGGPTREGAHSAHLKDVDIGQRYSLIHVLKSGVTTTFDIGGAGGEPERYVDMVDQVGIRCAAGPSYKNVSFFHDKQGRLEYDWDDERGSKGLKTAVDFAKKYQRRMQRAHDRDALSRPRRLLHAGVAARHQESGAGRRSARADSCDDQSVSNSTP